MDAVNLYGDHVLDADESERRIDPRLMPEDTVSSGAG